MIAISSSPPGPRKAGSGSPGTVVDATALTGHQYTIDFTVVPAKNSASTLAFVETESTNCTIRSFLLRKLGLALIARSMAARISLSSPEPFFFRYFSTSIRM